jgi:hypothetical protein
LVLVLVPVPVPTQFQKSHPVPVPVPPRNGTRIQFFKRINFSSILELVPKSDLVLV